MGRTIASAPPSAYWRLGPPEALAALGCSSHRLTSEEARDRLARFGPNELEAARGAGDLGLLLRQFTSPIVPLLVFATILSLILGETTDAAIILGPCARWCRATSFS
jgi:magnesium-transporting ATPase (P-type)